MSTKENIIIVLAGGVSQDGVISNITKERLDLAISLWQENKSGYLIMSGAWSLLLDHKPIKTEAEAMKNYALTCGVPSENILLENKSKDTIGNAYFVKTDFLEPNNWHHITVVTSDFHLERARYIFSKVLDNHYSTEFVTSLSHLDPTEKANRILVEEKLLKIAREWMNPIESGNNQKIKKLLDKFPGYSDKPEISKDYLKQLTQTIKY